MLRRGRRRCGRLSAARFLREDDLADLVDQLLRVEGLVGPVVGACVASTILIVRRIAAREHDDGRGRAAPSQLLRERVAVIARIATENGVHDEDPGVVPELSESALSVLGGDDLKILATKSDLEDLSHRDAVVDSEQGLGHWSSPIYP